MLLFSLGFLLLTIGRPTLLAGLYEHSKPRFSHLAHVGFSFVQPTLKTPLEQLCNAEAKPSKCI